MPQTRLKFGRVVNDEDVPFNYENRFFEETPGPRRRLVIGPSDGHVRLLKEFSAMFDGQWWGVLYVLLQPRGSGHEPGRYESELFASHEELVEFLSEFEDFFESDGRHHIWIADPEGSAQLVYDQHNVIFAYGAIDRYRQELLKRGYKDQEFWFPSPHFHAYWPENDAVNRKLLTEWEWKYFPLAEDDKWK